MEVLKELELPSHPDLIQSFEEGADAAIYKLNDSQAIVFSLDFFTPIVNDPYVFGQIAAANSLSDIYVVGATPLLCLNIICFPKKFSLDILKQILKGGLDKVKEAGALLVGGHSVDDEEPKYGLAVVGIVHPEEIISHKNAKEGDLLYLTKPLGTGIFVTALKGKLLDEKSPVYTKVINLMTQLNNKALEVMKRLKLQAATDVTGFGLIGHALDMAMASKKKIIIESSKVPIIEEVLDFVRMGIIPAGDYDNLNFCTKFVKISEKIPDELKILLADAQTSGGFIIAVPPDKKEKFEETAKELGLFVKQFGHVEKFSYPYLEIV